MATVIATFACFNTFSVTPSPSELESARAWWNSTFAMSNPSAPGQIEVVFEDVADGLTRGQSWRGTAFQLGDKAYTHGLAFNANKNVLVRLGQPAERFTAEVGLENNDDTRRGESTGNGSVTFHVLVNGAEVFKTPVLRRKDGAVPLSVELQGAREFEIRVRDGGDGRGWDQALWADAMIILKDGSRLRLQDLPMAGAVENPFGFSFTYQDQPSMTWLKNWPREVRDQRMDAARTRREVTWRDPATGLEVRVEATLFTSFPAVEWVVYFKNTGTADTPIVEEIQALDSVLVPAATAPRLHWSRGAVASFDDFAPQEQVMKPGTKLHLQPGGGRSSSQVLPFFNVEGPNLGAIAVIGWSGEWAADFTSDARGQMRLKTGLARTHLKLHPGESIRTPRMLLLSYQGDRWRGQNLLRQFILAHHRPTPGGKPLIAPITCGNWGGTRAEIHLENIQEIIRHQLPIQYYWIDAEWYGYGGWPVNVGSWQFKKDLYPQGFKPLSDALRASGRELMLWFEPERVYKGTTWHKEHSEWLLDAGGDSLLLNLGNTEARKFLTDFISDRITEFGLGCYRQDFNIDPLGFWHKADAPDRQGMTEIRYIEGLYAFWDGLLERHPNLIIDNCASGGRRIDLETLGRATPFWRTDGPRDAIAHQCHSYGLLAWVPLSAISEDRAGDDYEFRSSMCSSLCLNWWVSGDAPAERIPKSFPFDWARATLDQYLKIREFYYGDYYPLTGYSQGRDIWMAYQLNRPDLKKSLVVALRRPDSPYETIRVALRDLEPEAFYRVVYLDAKQQHRMQGKEIISKGIPMQITSQPGSALVIVEKE
jgi:alpha-galactosidase